MTSLTITQAETSRFTLIEIICAVATIGLIVLEVSLSMLYPNSQTRASWLSIQILTANIY